MYATGIPPCGGCINTNEFASTGPDDFAPGGVSPKPEYAEVRPSGWHAWLADSSTRVTTWRYVGEGRGKFKPQEYDFVGEGHGSYVQEVALVPGRINKLKVCLLLFIMASALLVLLMWLISKPSALGGAGSAWVRPLVSVNMDPFDCVTGEDKWAADWGEDQKDWCCANHGKGCMPQMQGCATDCNYEGKSYSCHFRIQWGANHKYVHSPNACAQAYDMVSGQCPWCGKVCSLADSKCIDPR